MLVKVERVTHSLYWLGYWEGWVILEEIWFGCYKKKIIIFFLVLVYDIKSVGCSDWDEI